MNLEVFKNFLRIELLVTSIIAFPIGVAICLVALWKILD